MSPSKSLLIAILAFAACGQNSNNPVNNSNDQKKGPKDTCETPTTALKDRVVSISRNWMVDYSWQVGPKVGGEDLEENKMDLVLMDGLGSKAYDVHDVEVTAWMPEHKHGTGNEVPQTEMKNTAESSISNIWFSMTGKWEVIIKAKVNGWSDEARFCVDVKN